MNKNLLLPLIFLLSAINLFPQGQWKLLQPELTTKSIFNIKFTDSLTGYFLSENAIIKTTDGGDSWEKLNTPSSYTYLDFFFLNKKGWLSTNEGKLYITNDAAKSWAEIYSSEKRLKNFHFFNCKHGFAIGDNKYIMKTIDGGNNWDSTYLNDNLNTASFTDEQHGWCGGNYKTTDGGITWAFYDNNLTTVPEKLKFFDSLSGFRIDLKEYENFYSTTNGGLTWNVLDISTIAAYDFSFQNKDNFILYGTPGNSENSILQTTNGGQTFKWIYVTPEWKSTMAIQSIVFNPNGTMFFATNHGFIFRKQNANWTFKMSNKFSGITINDIFPKDEQNVIAAGGSTIFWSNDGGNNWTCKNIPDIYPIKKLNFIGNQGWAICNHLIWNGSRFIYPAQIIKTVDNGEHWEISLSHEDLELNDIIFMDSLTGLITTGSGMLRTTDGGISWCNIFPDSIRLSSIHFINDSIAYLSAKPRFYKSTNSGLTWSLLSNHFYSNFDFACLNNKTFITLDYRSEDEGITWNYTSHPENGNNWDSQLHFVNENLGFSVLNCSDGGGYDTWGSLLMTTDGGKNWNYVYKNLFEKELYSIRFEKSGVGWACGKNGTVLKYEPDISSIINAPVQKTIPVTLLQNYPNPFNPTTTIKYSVAGQGKVSIFIYDLLGRVISKLLDEEKPAGEYKITWNASACPSGIYFIRMQTGQFSQSRKIILMK